MSRDKSAKKDKAGKKDKDNKKKDDLSSAVDLEQALTQAARSLRTALSHKLNEAGLYAGQDAVILAIAEQGCATPGHIAQKLGVKAPTITRTITRLEAQGFVERSSDEVDGRLTMIKLTESGEKTVAHIKMSLAECSENAIEGLSAKEVKNLVKVLRLVDENLQKMGTSAEDF